MIFDVGGTTIPYSCCLCHQGSEYVLTPTVTQFANKREGPHPLTKSARSDKKAVKEQHENVPISSQIMRDDISFVSYPSAL